MATLPDSANATTLDSSTTSATLELFRAVLGPVNTDYYLKAFTGFDAKDRAGPSWNWAAGLLTLNWLALRQLWGAALAYVGTMLAAALLVFGIGRLAFGLSDEAQVAWLVALLALSIAVPGVFGNAWLYNASRKKMEKALTVNATLADACAMLRRQAASRQRLIGLAIGNGVLLAGFAGLAFSYQSMQSPTAFQSPVAAKPIEPVDMAIKAAPAASQASAVASPASTSAAGSASAAITGARAPAAMASTAATPTASASIPAARASETSQVASVPSSIASAVSVSQTPVAAASKPGKAKPKPEKATEPEHRFLVNVGLFADPNNARNAAAKLEDAGITPLINEIETGKGTRTRVRAGPFASQAEAERAADKIQFIGLDAVVVRK
jgi:cell division septation protein DedD